MLLAVVGAKAEVLWTGTATTGNWGGSEGQYAVVDKASFSSAVAGNIIKVTISNYNTTDATYWQYSLKQYENSWNALPNFDNGNLTLNAENACYCLTADDVTALKNYGLVIQGYYITITKIELLATSSAVEIYSDGTGTALNGNTYGTSTYLNYSYGDKGSFETAYKNDFIRITYACTAESGDYSSYLQVGNPGSWANSYSIAGRKGLNSGNSGTFTYQIANASVLEGIQQSGTIIFGDKVTVTKVELVKATDRYDAVPLTIGSDGIATFGSSKNLDFSGFDNIITPYYASALAEGTVTLTPASKTRQWAGYIIQGTQGDYDVPVAAEAPEWLDDFNNLRYSGDYDNNKIYRSVYSDYSGGGDDETNIKTKYRYIFAKNGSNIGFYILPTDYSESGNPYHILNRHKAYLETGTNLTPSGTGGARVALIFDDGEATTSIQAVEKKQVVNDNVYFTLSGQRVQNPTRGLYIVNGKKVVIK